MDALNSTASLHEYSFVLPFERNFSPLDAKKWMEQRWHTGFYFSAIYVLFVFTVRRLMANSKPYSLNKPLLIWNIALSFFSISAFLRTAPEFLHTLNNHGIYHSVCVSRYVTEFMPCKYYAEVSNGTGAHCSSRNNLVPYGTYSAMFSFLANG